MHVNLETSKLTSLQNPDGAFRFPAELEPRVGHFFAENDGLVGEEFARLFARTFEIDDLSIKDRHYALYQNILYRFQPDNFRYLSSECRAFSDPLASSLLLRCAGSNSTPHGFIALDIWDTCYCAWHLIFENEIDAARRAVKWLLSQQQPSGGWACSTQYPLEDSDTTAAILILLKQFEATIARKAAVTKAFEWLALVTTSEGLVKTFNESFGVPTPDTTAITLVAHKVWGIEPKAKSLDWLKASLGLPSYWYASNERLRSCQNYLLKAKNVEPKNIFSLSESNFAYNIRFMGNIFVKSNLWNRMLKATATHQRFFSEFIA